MATSQLCHDALCTMIQAFFRLSHHPPGGKGEEIGIGKEIFIFSEKNGGSLKKS